MKAMLESGRQVRKHLFFFELNMMVGSRSKKNPCLTGQGLRQIKKSLRNFNFFSWFRNCHFFFWK